MQIEWYEESSANPVSKLVMTYRSDPGNFSAPYSIPAFSKGINLYYKLEARLYAHGAENNIAKFEASYFMEVSPLQVMLQGGNRVHAFARPLFIEAVTKDPDVQFENEKGINKAWSCINLINQKACTTNTG